MNKRSTLKDVAKAAEVSVSAASMILNNAPNPFSFSEETKRKVFDAAKALSYRPNAQARAMLSGKTGNIAILISTCEKIRSIYAEFLIQLSDLMKPHRLNIVICIAKDLQEYLSLKAINELCVDGIIAIDNLDERILSEMKASGLPCVFVNSEEREERCVVLDDFKGAFEAVSYLLELGHKRIAFANANFAHGSSSKRAAGYQAALDSKGIAWRRELRLAYCENAAPAIASLMRSDEPPTAIFFYGDEFMISALSWLHSSGYSVPEDVSLIGWNDDPSFLVYVSPGLSSVSFPYKEMAAKSFEMLLKEIESGKPQPSVVLEEKLVVRESCARLE